MLSSGALSVSVVLKMDWFVLGVGYMRGNWKDGVLEFFAEWSGVMDCSGIDNLAFGLDAMADSSTITDGRRPLV